MHVLIIGQFLNANHATKLAGGIQTSERDYVQLLLNAGHQVTFFCPQDSERLFESPVAGQYIQWFCSAPSDDDLSWSGNRAKAKRVEAEEAIDKMNPDVVINHSFSSGHVGVAAKTSKDRPVLCVIHNPPAAASDISLLAKLQSYMEITDKGGALVCVSQYQRDLWRRYLKRRISSGKSRSLDFLPLNKIVQIFDKFCYPAFARPPAGVIPADPDQHFTLITRPDHHKRVGPFLSLWNKAGPSMPPLHLFLSQPGMLEDCEYYVKKMKNSIDAIGNRITVYHNAPRDKLLYSLSSAAGSLIPRPDETFGIIFIEAGIAGVPSIVWTEMLDGRVDHATFELMYGDHAGKYINLNLTDDEQITLLKIYVKQVCGRLLTQRQATGAEFMTQHGEEARRKQLLALIESVVQHHKKPKSTLLGF